jgi:hypothetical protein
MSEGINEATPKEPVLDTGKICLDSPYTLTNQNLFDHGFLLSWPAGLGDMAIGVTALWVLFALRARPNFAASRLFPGMEPVGSIGPRYRDQPGGTQFGPRHRNLGKDNHISDGTVASCLCARISGAVGGDMT